MKRSDCPSGDQAGWQAPSGRVVSWVSPDPSTPMRKICGRPVRSLTNAICPPPPPLGVGPGVGVGVGAGVSVGVAVIWGKVAAEVEVAGRRVTGGVAVIPG